MPRGRRPKDEPPVNGRPPVGKGKYYMISVVARSYGIHPQTLRLYEREGLLKPSRTEGNTRLYSEDDLRQLEVILNLTRDLGVNLAGIEIVLNMRRKMEQMQTAMNDFVAYVKEELLRANREGWQERFQQALVRLPPTHLMRTAAQPAAVADATPVAASQATPAEAVIDRTTTEAGRNRSPAGTAKRSRGGEPEPGDHGGADDAKHKS